MARNGIENEAQLRFALLQIFRKLDFWDLKFVFKPLVNADVDPYDGHQYAIDLNGDSEHDKITLFTSLGSQTLKNLT